MTRPENQWDIPLIEKFKFLYQHIAKDLNGDVVEFKNRLGDGVKLIKPSCKSLIGIDNNKERIQKKASQFPSVKFIFSELNNIKFIVNSTIDHVVFFHGLQTCPNTPEVIEEIHRILKPGGQLYLSVPNALYKGPKLGNVVTPFTPEDIKTAFKRYVNIRSFGIYGNEKVDAYAQKREELFKKAVRFNPLYKILAGKAQVNRINDLNSKISEKLKNDESLQVNSITSNDYYLNDNLENCSDLFFQIEKCECEL